MARPKSDENKPLTESEMPIMNILWQEGPSTVHDVLEKLTESQNKDFAYTTVSTMLRVLEKKGAVKSQKEGRGHRYQASLEKSKYQKKATDHLVNQVFQGERTALIRNLLGDANLSAEELKEVRALLKSKAEK